MNCLIQLQQLVKEFLVTNKDEKMEEVVGQILLQKQEDVPLQKVALADILHI